MYRYRDTEMVRCPDCGTGVLKHMLDTHREQCDGQRQEFDGECPLCGEQYRNYMAHLIEACSARSGSADGHSA